MALLPAPVLPNKRKLISVLNKKKKKSGYSSEIACVRKWCVCVCVFGGVVCGVRARPQ